MPWIEVYSPALNQNQKKEVATRLVEAVVKTLNVPQDMPGVEFKTNQPENLFVKGQFLSEKQGEQTYHLNIIAPPINAEQKRALYQALHHAFSQAMNLNEPAQQNLCMSLIELPMDNFAKGGRPMSEQLAGKR